MAAPPVGVGVRKVPKTRRLLHLGNFRQVPTSRLTELSPAQGGSGYGSGSSGIMPTMEMGAV